MELIKSFQTTIKQGHFYCPNCRSNQPFEHIEVSKKLTIFGAAIFNVAKPKHYVECGKCKSTFLESILDANNEALQRQHFLSEYQKAVKKLLIQMIWADGVIDEEEKGMMQRLLRELSGIELDLDVIEEEILKERHAKVPAKEYLREIAPYLNADSRRRVIQAAFRIASSDGALDEWELAHLREFGAAMNMRIEEVTDAIDRLSKDMQA